VYNSFQKFASFSATPSVAFNRTNNLFAGLVRESLPLSRRINMERATNREKGLPAFVFIAMILVSVVGLLYVFVHQ
jgi:hypothetical protein